MRTSSAEHRNLMTVAVSLKAAGVKPTISAVLRYSLQVAADTAEAAEPKRPTGKVTAKADKRTTVKATTKP